jgi:hypothetical protein
VIGADESSASIANGVAWGQQVADAIWTWRSTDGFNTAAPTFARRRLPAVLFGADMVRCRVECVRPRSTPDRGKRTVSDRLQRGEGHGPPQ